MILFDVGFVRECLSWFARAGHFCSGLGLAWRGGGLISARGVVGGLLGVFSICPIGPGNSPKSALKTDGMSMHMNAIQVLSNSELIAYTRQLAIEERRMTALVLEHLEEIEARRIHLDMAFPSLFEFCRQELGYSED
jgi:hypothetical protein